MARRKRKAAKRGPATASRAYEAAQATPQRRHVVGAQHSQDSALSTALGRLRNWGRYLDENLDIAGAILDDLTKGTVGSGILALPKPCLTRGVVDAGLAADILELWQAWVRRCDVTGELHWNHAQRIMCRSWDRDGEQFIQHVSGRDVPYPFTPDDVPYRLELIESEMVPHEFTALDQGWRQGIRHNSWRMPTEYAVHKVHPGDSGMMGAAPVPGIADVKRVPADRITHLKHARRWPATRGTTIFASVITRLHDIKDVEESERIKNRILASWCAAIVKSPDLIGVKPDSTDEGADSEYAESADRFIEIASGQLIDSLAPGESIEGVGPEYPNTGINDYVGDQIRRVAAGTGTRYSAISKRYENSYSAQRQETVDGEGHYRAREMLFVEKVVRPVYERWLTAAILDGKIRLPRAVTLREALCAEFRGPIVPWVDPLKEVQSDALAVENGFASLEQIQIKRGASPEIIGKRPPAQPAQPARPNLTVVDDDDDETGTAA